MIGPGPNLLSDWFNNLGLRQSAHSIFLSTFMGVGMSMCLLLGSSGQREVGREFLLLFFFFFFFFAETGVGFSCYKGSYVDRRSPDLTMLLCF